MVDRLINLVCVKTSCRRGSERTSYHISTSANYDLSDQCVPAMVAQWAVELGERDAHFFLLGTPPWAGPKRKTLLRRNKRTGVHKRGQGEASVDQWSPLESPPRDARVKENQERLVHESPQKRLIREKERERERERERRGLCARRMETLLGGGSLSGIDPSWDHPVFWRAWRRNMKGRP